MRDTAAVGSIAGVRASRSESGAEPLDHQKIFLLKWGEKIIIWGLLDHQGIKKIYWGATRQEIKKKKHFFWVPLEHQGHFKIKMGDHYTTKEFF